MRHNGYPGAGRLDYPGNPNGIPYTTRGNPGNITGHHYPGPAYCPIPDNNPVPQGGPYNYNPANTATRNISEY